MVDFSMYSKMYSDMIDILMVDTVFGLLVTKERNVKMYAYINKCECINKFHLRGSVVILIR